MKSDALLNFLVRRVEGSSIHGFLSWHPMSEIIQNSPDHNTCATFGNPFFTGSVYGFHVLNGIFLMELTIEKVLGSNG